MAADGEERCELFRPAVSGTRIFLLVTEITPMENFSTKRKEHEGTNSCEEES